MASVTTMTAFLVALVVALVATPGVVVLVRRADLIDIPNDRSSHATPVPRGGGIAVALAAVVGVAAGREWSDAVVGLVIGAAVLGLIGLVDDRHGLPAVPRLLVQLLTPVVITVALVDLSGWRLLVAVIVASVIVSGFVNAFNFMDGINGISGSQAVIIGLFLSAVADHVDADRLSIAGWAVCGASLGFLPFNAVRAWVFLGDVGSYFLGFWLAGLGLLVVDAGAPALVVLGPFLLYLLDTSTVLIRRARRGESLMQAHRQHAYQRLADGGWSHLSVAALCALVSAVCAVVMFAAIDSSTLVQSVAMTFCISFVGGYLALPNLLGDRAGRTSGVAP